MRGSDVEFEKEDGVIFDNVVLALGAEEALLFHYLLKSVLEEVFASVGIGAK